MQSTTTATKVTYAVKVSNATEVANATEGAHATTSISSNPMIQTNAKQVPSMDLPNETPDLVIPLHNGDMIRGGSLCYYSGGLYIFVSPLGIPLLRIDLIARTLACGAARLTVHNSLLPNTPFLIRDKYSVFEDSKVTIPKSYGNNKDILRFQAILPDNTIALDYFINPTKFMKDDMYVNLFGQIFQVLPEIKQVPDGVKTSFLLKDGETLTLMTIAKVANTVLGIQKTIGGRVYLYELPFNKVIGFEYFPLDAFKKVLRKDVSINDETAKDDDTKSNPTKGNTTKVDAVKSNVTKGDASLIPKVLSRGHVYCSSLDNEKLCFLGAPNKARGYSYSFSSICKDKDLNTPYFDINNLSLLSYPIKDLPQLDYLLEHSLQNSSI